jgi:hypothetical protein
MQSKGMDEALPALGGSAGCANENAVGMPAASQFYSSKIQKSRLKDH